MKERDKYAMATQAVRYGLAHRSSHSYSQKIRKSDAMAIHLLRKYDGNLLP
jgi:hypothetical protein